MLFFTSQKVISTVKRLSYSGSPAKGTLSTVATNLTGYLRPLSEEDAAASQLQWGTAFTLITELGVNILKGDVITIASQDYTVRGLAVHDRGFFTTYNKYLLTRPQS